MTKIRINKLDAAQRQIATAIELLFSRGDPVAIHTLVGAGWRILRDLSEKQATPGHLELKAAIRPGMESKFWSAMNNAMNFFKHARQDADAVLEIDEEVNDSIILLAIRCYMDLGNQQSVEMLAFTMWYCLIHPDMFQAPVEEEIRKIGVPDWADAPRAEQLEAGRLLLSRKRGPK